MKIAATGQRGAESIKSDAGSKPVCILASLFITSGKLAKRETSLACQHNFVSVQSGYVDNKKYQCCH